MSLRSRKKSGDLIGYVIIAFSVILVLGIGAFMFSTQKSKIKVNKQTYCPKDAEPYGKVIALIDLTDPLNKAQKEFFIKEIDSIKQSIPRYHNLTIYTLDQSLDLEINKKLSKCNPGTLEDIKDTFEKISNNPTKIRNNWEKGFSREISNTIDNIILRTKSQSTSPVMEMFQLIAIKEFNNFEGTENKIIILSDMIQNANDLSMYNSGIPKFSRFSTTPYFSKIRTDLKDNVDVNLLIIKRDGFRKQQESGSFLQFWAQFFVNGNNAKNFKSKFVDG